MLNMNLSKKDKKGIFVNSRELSAEELTQVGGAWGASDSGYDVYSDYDSYYDDYGYEAGGSDYYDVPTPDYDSMIQAAVDANQQWLDANPIQIEIFTIGDFTLSYSGSFTEGINTAFNDCFAGATGVGLGNHFGTVAGSTVLNSSQAAVLGCTLGVGEGIIRDLFP